MAGGNSLTAADEVAKLAMIVKVAGDVWLIVSGMRCPMTGAVRTADCAYPPHDDAMTRGHMGREFPCAVPQ